MKTEQRLAFCSLDRWSYIQVELMLVWFGYEPKRIALLLLICNTHNSLSNNTVYSTVTGCCSWHINVAEVKFVIAYEKTYKNSWRL